MTIQKQETGAQERYALVAGYRTHYVVAGDGPPILLVHGVGGSLVTYRRNIDALATVGRVYALDLPGHGLSEIVAGEYSAERGGAFLCAFIEAVIGAPAALVGVSAGGLMSIIAASERPELVTRLVLVDSAGFGRDVAWKLRLLTLPFADRLLRTASLQQVQSALQRHVHDPATDLAEVADAQYQQWQQPDTRRALLNALRSNISLFGVRRWRRHLHRASVLALPVLIVWGQNDRTLNVQHAYRAAQSIAGARLAIFDRCGHMPPSERPAEFNGVLCEFLA